MTEQAHTPNAPDSLAGRLRQWLERRTGQPVQALETHVSQVLLAGDCAYKLKKPVRLPFLDFSTLELRRHFCDEEVRLNRRLAPELYLDVLPVLGSVEAPWLPLEGQSYGQLGSDAAPAIDYAVRMRRFAADALLADQVANGQTGMDDMRELAQRLAAFHQDLPATPPQPDYGSPALVLDEVLKVLRQLQPTAFAAPAQHWAAWVRRQAQTLHAVWAQRHADGFIRECHGDLHLGNVVKLQGAVTAFDCIEFQPAMRWIDVVNDVAFLTMDLQAHGRADLAAGFIDDYLQATGDYAGLSTWRFYEVYRALVRVLVAQLSAGGGDPRAGRRYADWLDRATSGQLPAPRLFIMHGLSGSGKSTVARQLVEQAGAVRIRSDVERKRLFGLAALQDSHAQGLDIYTQQASLQTFDRLLQHARTGLRAGYPVVVDAAFLRHAERQRFAQLAREAGVPFAIVHCHAGRQVLQRRIEERARHGNDPSEADAAVLERQWQADEPFQAEEQPWVLLVETERQTARAGVAELLNPA